MDKSEVDKLKEYCRSAEFKYNSKLLQFAIWANPQIAPDIYYAIVRGASYEKLTRAKYIPMLKEDFYGYYRKTLADFRDWLVKSGLWTG